jgi:hypothetical protein
MVGLPPVTNPRITGVSQSGPSLVFSGTNGLPGSTYVVLSSTNIALPLSNWMRSATNTFGADGSFSYSANLDQSMPQQYYLLTLP